MLRRCANQRFMVAVAVGLALGNTDCGSSGPPEAPRNLTYSTNPAVYTLGVAIEANTPSSSGGAVDSYSVTPPLPAGLSINTSTGVITGTPTAVTAPENYTVTASNSGGSTTASLQVTVRAPLPGPELYDSATGTFAATGSLATPREHGHSATLLPSGKVLIAGGSNEHSGSLASAELYDPATGTFTATGSLGTARGGHTATLLPSGKVLIAGGSNFPPGALASSLASAELYDPGTGTFTRTGDLTTAREGHTATLLPSGKVLIAGGFNSATGYYLASAELYDPGTGTFTATGSMATARGYYHSATLLVSGKVLIAGGFYLDLNLASAELYDPVTETFAPTADLATGRGAHTATLLPNGKVLIVGGIGVGPVVLATAELYDAATAVFTATGDLAMGRGDHTATLLPSGKVLIAGGVRYWFANYLAKAELYDPATGDFTLTGNLATGRVYHTATLLPDGRVLIAGGISG